MAPHRLVLYLCNFLFGVFTLVYAHFDISHETLKITVSKISFLMGPKIGNYGSHGALNGEEPKVVICPLSWPSR